MSAYKIIVKNKAETVQWEIPYQNGQITWNLNNVHTASISVDFNYLKDSLVAQNTNLKDFFETAWLNIYIYKDGVLLFAGYISEVNYAASSENKIVRIDIKSWLGYFENRIYSGLFSSTDAGDIAWGLINAVNDISITKGTVTATKNRDRTYVYDEVAKSVIALSNNNLDTGIDFDITNQKVFTASSRLGSDLANIIFDEEDILSYTVKVGLIGNIFNKAYIMGGGMGDSQVIRDYAVTTPYTTNWNVLEGKTQAVNVEDTDVLDDQVTNFVELRKNPIRSYKLKVTTKFFDSYYIGDGIKIKIPDISLSDTLRVKKKTLYFGNDENVDLEFL